MPPRERELPSQIVTRDGQSLVVRPIEAGDKEALLRGFEELGEESRYRRFLTPTRRLSGEDVAYLTEVDHVDHEAIVALTADGAPVGVARFVRLRDRPTVAEVAVTVVDRWQGQGVGTSLTHLLARRARECGIERFAGICLAGNRDMRDLLADLSAGSRAEAAGDGLVEIEVELPEEVERGDVASAVRLAARSSEGR